MEKVNRVEAAKARIDRCARSMGYELTDAELTRFAIIQCGLADDARASVKEKLAGQPAPSTPAPATVQLSGVGQRSTDKLMAGRAAKEAVT